MGQTAPDKGAKGRITKEWLPAEMGFRQRLTFVRFDLSQRVEHLVVVSSTVVLALTGLPQMFHDADLARSLMAVMGGIATIRTVHHLVAIVLMLEAVYHILAALYRIFRKGAPLSMMLTRKDLKDAGTMVQYLMGTVKERPRFDRFSFSEKLTYWTVVWILLITVVSGLIMWFPTKAALLMEGVWVTVAKTAHGWDAILLLLTLLIWHFWQVHVKRWNTSIFDGKMSKELMREEHPLEYIRLVAEEGLTEIPPFTVVK